MCSIVVPLARAMNEETPSESGTKGLFVICQVHPPRPASSSRPPSPTLIRTTPHHSATLPAEKRHFIVAPAPLPNRHPHDSLQTWGPISLSAPRSQHHTSSLGGARAGTHAVCAAGCPTTPRSFGAFHEPRTTARTFSRPPQAHASASTPKVRLSRSLQGIQLAVTRLALGVGTKAASFSTSSSSDNKTWEVPSDQGVFNARAMSPSSCRLSRAWLRGGLATYRQRRSSAARSCARTRTPACRLK